MNHSQTVVLSRTSSLHSIAEPWWHKYLGVPFVMFGRDMKGWDCWGCVRYIMQEQLGVELPNIDGGRSMNVPEESNKSIWHEVEKPQQWDLLCMYGPTKSGPMLVHIGLMVSDSKVLHCQRGCGTICVPLNHKMIRPGKFIRHDSMLLSRSPV